MDIKSAFKDRYLLALIAISAVYVAFWIIFSMHQYLTFSDEYWDIGGALYGAYWHLHGLNYYSNPMQYIVFMNHLSPFSSLIFAFFALFQRPVTLFAIQDIFLAMTAILAYLVSADLLKSKKIGLAMALAFLINPGTIGLVIFDFHLEAFILFFYILSFYYYMKRKMLHFALSYMLFLSVLEVAPLLGSGLIIGLLAYELLYARSPQKNDMDQRNDRLRILAVGVILTVLSFAFYREAAIYTIKSYGGMPNSGIVPIQRLSDFVSQQFSGIGKVTDTYSFGFFVLFAIAGLVAFFLGFGGIGLTIIPVGLLLCSPWLTELLIVHNPWFIPIYNHQYTYALGGSFVAAILGFMLVSGKKMKVLGIRLYEKKFESLLALAVIGMAAFTSLLMIPFNGSMIQFAGPPQVNYTQINQVLRMIPENSSVLAQVSLAPHLFYIHNLELSPKDILLSYTLQGTVTYWMQPDYIVVDRNLSGYNELVNETYSIYNGTALPPFNIYNYTDGNYTTYYNSSGLYIFKRIGYG